MRNSVSPFGASGRRRIVLSDQPPPAGDGARWRKPPTRPSASSASASTRARDVEVVDRHREAALGLVAAPRRRDGRELVLELGRDVVGGDDAERVAGLLEPRDRLAHLADRAALERELLRPQHGLLPDRDRLEAERAIALEVRVGCADDREPPAAGADEPPQLGEEVVDLRLVADGIAADERRAGDDAVREEGAARGREEIALVAAQREEGEAVAAVRLDERPRDPPLAHASARRPGRTVAARSRARAKPQARPRPRARRRRGAGGRRRVARTRREGGDPDERRAETEQRPDARGVAGHVEAAPPADERDEQEQRDRRLLDVESLREVRRRRTRRRRRPRAATRAGGAWRASARARSDRSRRRSSGRARASGQPGGRTPWTSLTRSGHLRASAPRRCPITPTSAAHQARSLSALRRRETTPPGYNVLMREVREPVIGGNRRTHPDPAAALGDAVARSRRDRASSRGSST